MAVRRLKHVSANKPNTHSSSDYWEDKQKNSACALGILEILLIPWFPLAKISFLSTGGKKVVKFTGSF